MFSEIECAKQKQELAVGRSERPSVMIELQRRREDAVQRLQDIEAAIELFEKQPELEKALTSIGRLGIHL